MVDNYPRAFRRCGKNTLWHGHFIFLYNGFLYLVRGISSFFATEGQMQNVRALGNFVITAQNIITLGSTLLLDQNVYACTYVSLYWTILGQLG